MSPFAVIQLVPLVASVSIGGRISAANGNGIRNVIILLTDSNGQTRRVKTGTFGYYRFDDVVTGETYTISVAAKRFTFAQPTRTLNVNEVLTDIDWVAEE